MEKIRKQFEFWKKHCDFGEKNGNSKKNGNPEENFENLENLKLEIDNWIIDLT